MNHHRDDRRDSIATVGATAKKYEFLHSHTVQKPAPVIEVINTGYWVDLFELTTVTHHAVRLSYYPAATDSALIHHSGHPLGRIWRVHT